MAGEHDFAPLSDADVDACADGGRYAAARLGWMHYASMARELRATRAAMRALVEAQEAWRNTPTASRAKDAATIRVVQAEDAIRALVAHVGAEGEGRS